MQKVHLGMNPGWNTTPTIFLYSFPLLRNWWNRTSQRTLDLKGLLSVGEYPDRVETHPGPRPRDGHRRRHDVSRLWTGSGRLPLVSPELLRSERSGSLLPGGKGREGSCLVHFGFMGGSGFLLLKVTLGSVRSFHFSLNKIS